MPVVSLHHASGIDERQTILSSAKAAEWLFESWIWSDSHFKTL